MEGAFRTPLLDFFRRGEVPLEIRMLAAQGALAPRAHEQLGLLMLLVDDADPGVVSAAESTLQSLPRAAVASFLGRSDVPTEMRAFFAARGIEAAPAPGGSPEDADADGADAPLVDHATEPASPSHAEEPQTTLQRIAAMTVAQRVALAMKGTREERAVLIRDSNKIVGVAVLSSPKMTENEAESIAKMATVSEELLRIIANTRAWMKRYTIVAALARNPKTPVAISLNLLNRLTEKDVRAICSDRNVPEVLRLAARQKIVKQHH